MTMTCPSCNSRAVLPAGWINDGVTGPKCDDCGHEWTNSRVSDKDLVDRLRGLVTCGCDEAHDFQVGETARLAADRIQAMGEAE